MKKRLLLYPLMLGLLIGCSRDERGPLESNDSNQNPSSTSNLEPSGRANLNNNLTGVVISVKDGDTVTVVDENDDLHEVRLKGIDAPERRRRQPFGEESRIHLARRIAGKTVTIEWQKRDRNGRIVGKILLDGHDSCLEQIKAGFAWHYKAFEGEQTDSDRELYAQAEKEARQLKQGLWKDLAPVAPWSFRHPEIQSEGP